MRRAARLALVAGLWFPWVAAAAPAADVRIERRAEFVDRVNAAIDRGVTWLRGAQQAGGVYDDHPGYPGGVTALAYHTLRICGVPADDPVAAAAFDAMRQTYAAAKRRGDLRTYSVGLFCMALAEHGEPTTSPQRPGEPLRALSEVDAAWMKELVKFLEDAQNPRGAWSYPLGNRSEAYDNSNTQYALLGLKAASRAGAAVKSSTWLKALRHFLDSQEDGGPAVPRFEATERGRTSGHAVDRARGWGYIAGGTVYGSMTAGGVGSVVICRSELAGKSSYPPGLDAKAEESIRDGLAWLGRNFSVRSNPGLAGPMVGGLGWHYYYLYAVERAGVLAGVDWMGERDWYGEGAEFLLGDQLAGGAWARRGGEGAARGLRGAGFQADSIVTTCFALLFLKRGTLPVARGALTRAFDDSDINFAGAGQLSESDFEDLVDLVLARWRRASGDGAARILAQATALGPRIVLPLVLRLDSTKDKEREAAIALLRRAVGLDHGYDPSAPRDKREDAIAKWQGWWLANGGKLRYDGDSGRIVVSGH